MLENRDLNPDLARRDEYLNNPAVGEGSGYGPLVALCAIAAIIGGLFFFAPRGEQQVATGPAVERTVPAPAPATPAPPPAAPTAPQQ